MANDPLDLARRLQAAHDKLRALRAGNASTVDIRETEAVVMALNNGLWEALSSSIVPMKGKITSVYRRVLGKYAVNPGMPEGDGFQIAHDEDDFYQNVSFIFIQMVKNGDFLTLNEVDINDKLIQISWNMAIDQWRMQRVRDRYIGVSDISSNVDDNDRGNEAKEDEEKKEYSASDMYARTMEFSKALVDCRDRLPQDKLQLRETLDIWTDLWEALGDGAPLISPTVTESFRLSTGNTPAQKVEEILGIAPSSVNLRKKRIIKLMKECLEGKGFEDGANEFAAGLDIKH